MDDVNEVVQYYKLEPRREGESDNAYRQRVAGQLRDMGEIVLAHEISAGKRFDDPDGGEDVITGIMGAMAQALEGRDYGRRGEQQVGDDIAAGHVIRNPRPKMSPEMALLAVLMFGGRD